MASSSSSQARLLSILLACAGTLLLGCAEERPPINRVQANALEKSFFVGDLDDPDDNPEFYFRNTVVDVSMGAGADGLFTNSDGMPTSRIRWEITEDALVARLAYELVDDTDFKGARNSPGGQAVAAYEIVKHFDILRDYNPETGEELNVVVENDQDRPWYEREYFRVDWSTNLITSAYDFDTLSQIGIYYGVEYEPVSYYVSDANDPDAPVFDVEDGYFDVTTRAYAKPQILEDEWGPYLACWLTGAWPAVSCDPSEVTLRQSYWKVGERDYEPLHYGGDRMDLFGFFTVDRQGYDRSYGIVDDEWRRFATRWNLFERTHADPPVACNTRDTTPVGADPHRDEDGDGTEDECAAVGAGARCDEFSSKCTLPLRERPVRTIPWYVNRGFPEDLWDGTEQALGKWSDALRVAVVAGRLVECRRTGGADCEKTMGWPTPWSDDFVPRVGSGSPAEVPQIFVLCHNPVDPSLGDSEEHCGPKGTSPRAGDIRYSFVNVVQDPEIASPWGIQMDVEDPLTGEKIAGSVTEWGAVLDRASATVADLLGLLNGEIDPEQYITGQNVSDFVAANQRGGSAERLRPMGAIELRRRKAAYDASVVAPYLAGLGRPRAGSPPLLKHRIRLQELADHGRLGPGNAVLDARLRALRGTDVEVKLITPEMRQAAGFEPDAPVTREVAGRASPFGRMNPTVRRETERAKRIGRARRHGCRLEAPAPDNLLGLAKVARDRFGSPDPKDPAAVAEHRAEVILWARQQFSRGVMAHELGHAMGLRHNFAASFDSLNYEPGYWQLRTNNGAATADCPAGTTDGADCVAPRYRDPITQEEIDGNIGFYATTSVMDYPGDQSQDVVLPRKYDRAAVRFGYGGVVDVWEEASVDASGAEQAEAYELTAFTQSPGLFGVVYLPPVNPADPYGFLHYSGYQREFRLLRDCRSDDSDKAVLGQVCDERPMDVVDYRDMHDFVPDPSYQQFSWARQTRAVDDRGRVRRGYMFSGDEYADSGNVPSFTGDAGADAYEQIRFLEGQYENRYVLDAFRRHRVDFNSWDVSGRIQSRYLDKIQLIAKAFAFGVLLEGDPADPDPAILDDGFYGPLEVGTTVALDLFARIMTRPDPGYYCEAYGCGFVDPVGVEEPVYVADPAPVPAAWDYDFRIALGEGRYLHNDYDYTQGYWWGDYQSRVGSYYDKIWATYYFAEAFDSFISSSKEDFTDSRYKNVSFATVFPNQVRRLFTNLMTGDLESYAPWVTPSGGGDVPRGSITYPDWFDPTDVGQRPKNALMVDPSYAWNEQLYAAVWGATFFPTDWSQRWIHDARIALLPSERPDWPASETIAFYYPPTGMRYQAHSMGTEEVLGWPVEKSMGARMLEWANWLTTYVYEVETDAQGFELFNLDGTPVLVLDADGKPIESLAEPGADAVLARYVDFIDTFRQITATFEQPLGEGSLPEP